MTKTTTVGLILVLAAGAAACAPTLRDRSAIVKTAVVCQPMTVQIYFERDSAVVTREADAVLKSAADTTRGCVVNGVKVVGLADAVGAAGANQKLSEERAKATTIALAKVGFTAPKFELAAAGDSGALTPLGQAAPLRRRADVVIDLAPAK